MVKSLSKAAVASRGNLCYAEGIAAAICEAGKHARCSQGGLLK